MHLFLVRDSTLGAFAHLHPLPLDSTTFDAAVPPLAAGRYRVYADIVNESGLAQTMVATVDLGRPTGTWREYDLDVVWTSTGMGCTGTVYDIVGDTRTA